MSRLEKSQVRRGMFLTSSSGGRAEFIEPPRLHYKRMRDIEDDEGADETLERLSRERKDLEARLDAVAVKIKALKQ